MDNLSESERDAMHLRLWEILQRDHGGCEEEGCCLAQAMNEGEDVLAFDIWVSSGAADTEFKTLYEQWIK